MPETAPATAAAAAGVPAKRPRFRWGYSLGALFMVVTAICLVQSYRTNARILKQFTPAPPADYDLDIEPYQFTDADFVQPFDPRPATVQLNERIAIIRDRITQLRARGRAKEADGLESRLDAALAKREGPYPMDGRRQLHAVGIYNGRPSIRVSYTGAPLVIVLCAYEGTHWTIEVDPGARLERVILGGYHPQTIEGVPDEVPVHGQIRNYRFYACRPEEVAGASEELQKLIRLRPTTFSTQHDLRSEPFVIGPENSEWSAMMTLAAMEALYQDAVREERTRLAAELVVHSFPEIFHAPNRRLSNLGASFAVHSIFGPYKETLRPLDESTNSLAVDPRGPSLFGFDWRNAEGLVTIDPEAGSVAPWPIAGLEVQPHCDSCLAFDTRRQRLLVWGGNLTALDVLKKEPMLVCTGNPGIGALTYSPHDDRLYALCQSWESDSSEAYLSELRTYNPRGAELSRVKLSVPIPGARRMLFGSSASIKLLGGMLVVMSVGNSSSYNYVFDPKSGKLLFACRNQPR
jgi:hypothetical protein